MRDKLYPIKSNQLRQEKQIFNIKIDNLIEQDILEKIKKFLKKREGIFHIVSLNPEILVISEKDKEFKEIFKKAQIRINDGVGVVIAGFLLGFGRLNRITGVDLFKKLLSWGGERSLSILLIGGKGKLANSIAICYQKQFRDAKYIGIEGIKNIRNISGKEEKRIFSIVSNLKPHLVFVAFGSPFQEKWIWKNRKRFKGAVVMGVGGGFDYVGGVVKRPPRLIRKLGFEWLWRLILQPWRAKRQLRLIRFTFLVLKEAWRKKLKMKL